MSYHPSRQSSESHIARSEMQTREGKQQAAKHNDGHRLALASMRATTSRAIDAGNCSDSIAAAYGRNHALLLQLQGCLVESVPESIHAVSNHTKQAEVARHSFQARAIQRLQEEI